LPIGKSIAKKALTLYNMREGKFLKKNVERWQSYAQSPSDPDTQAHQFVDLIDDLAYSKTYYPRSSTTTYLNAQAAQKYNSIYQHKLSSSGKLAFFFKYDLPCIFSRYHHIYLFTLIFFVACVVFGIVSSITNTEFVREILGDEYVDMTESNIAAGDPFGVYKSQNETLMFLQIAFNNIMVSFKVYSYGILLGIPALYLLFTNGVMVGAFHYMFFAKGLGLKSILVIWIHGTLELNAIVLAGTAGIMLGVGYLWPGTYTRMQSLRHTAKDSVKLLVCLIPFFIIAAFLEGFITRHTQMPIALSLTILIASFALIIGYFIVWPIILKKRKYSVKHGVLYINNIPQVKQVEDIVHTQALQTQRVYKGSITTSVILIFLLFNSHLTHAQYNTDTAATYTEDGITVELANAQIETEALSEIETEKPYTWQAIDNSDWQKLISDKALIYTSPKKQKAKQKPNTPKAPPMPAPNLNIIMIVLCVIVLLGIIYAIFGKQLRTSAPLATAADAPKEWEDVVNFNNWTHALQQAQLSRDYKLCTRILFLHTLQQMHNAGKINYDVNTTNSTYLLALFNAPYYNLFKQCATAFEHIWYGNYLITEAQYLQIKSQYNKLYQAIA
jgi:uncharacterized membrane protein SpoIIM required for sporulation